MSEINTAQEPRLGDLSTKYTAIMEDVVYEAGLTPEKIENALMDAKFQSKLQELFRDYFPRLSPF